MFLNVSQCFSMVLNVSQCLSMFLNVSQCYFLHLLTCFSAMLCCPAKLFVELRWWELVSSGVLVSPSAPREFYVSILPLVLSVFQCLLMSRSRNPNWWFIMVYHSIISFKMPFGGIRPHFQTPFKLIESKRKLDLSGEGSFWFFSHCFGNHWRSYANQSFRPNQERWSHRQSARARCYLPSTTPWKKGIQTSNARTVEDLPADEFVDEICWWT